MMPLSQNNAGGLINRAADKVSDFKDKVVNFKEGTEASIEVISTLCKKILEAIDFTTTILFNPDVMISFIDKMSIVIIIAMLILKYLGFENLEKWIWLTILLKVVVMCL